jgi:hypothetical protein
MGGLIPQFCSYILTVSTATARCCRNEGLVSHKEQTDLDKSVSVCMRMQVCKSRVRVASFGRWKKTVDGTE